MDDIDTQTVEQYLDTAQMHGAANNPWAEGFWLGRAIEHIEQNAMSYGWFTNELDQRGLDTGIVPVPKIETPPKG